MHNRRARSSLPRSPQLRRLVTLLYVATTLVGLCGSVWVKESSRSAGVGGGAVAGASSSSKNASSSPRKEECESARYFMPGHICFFSVGLAGHTVPLIRLAEEMMRRGYTATLITHDNMRHLVEAVPGLRFISAGPLPLAPEELRERLSRVSEGTSGLWNLLNLLSDVYLPLGLSLYNLSLDPLLQQQQPADNVSPARQQQRPDLIVVDVGAAGVKDLAEALGIPLVFNSPTLLFRLDNRPSYLPAWGTGFSVDMSILERCINLIFPRLLSVGLTSAFLDINRVRRAKKVGPIYAHQDMFRGSRIMVNTAMGLEYPQPQSSLIEMTGPLLPPSITYGENMTLPSIISNWLQWGTLSPPNNASSTTNKRTRSASTTSNHCSNNINSSNTTGSNSSSTSRRHAGVVYVNMGHMPQLSSRLTQAVVEGLTPLQPAEGSEPIFRVLWMLPPDQRPSLPINLPPNFRAKVLGDLPHLQILAHESVSLVISHCGMASAQEALYFNKPVLCIPSFADQLDVARRVMDGGAGLSLDRNHLTPCDVRKAVNSLLLNHSYTQKAAMVGAHLRAAGGVRAAADTLEQTLLLGTAHLKTPDIEQPWHKAAMVDVCVVYSAFVTLVAASLVMLWAAAIYLSVHMRERLSLYRAAAAAGGNDDKPAGTGSGAMAASAAATATSANAIATSSSHHHVELGPAPPPQQQRQAPSSTQQQRSSLRSSSIWSDETLTGGAAGSSTSRSSLPSSFGYGKPRTSLATSSFLDVSASLGLENYLGGGKEGGGSTSTSGVGERRPRAATGGEEFFHLHDDPLFDRCLEGIALRSRE